MQVEITNLKEILWAAANTVCILKQKKNSNIILFVIYINTSKYLTSEEKGAAKAINVVYFSQNSGTVVNVEMNFNEFKNFNPSIDGFYETLENFLMFNKLFGEIYETNEKKVMEQIKNFFCNEQGNN